MQHVPVLRDEILEALLPAGQVIDGTLGAGGHTRALLEAGAEMVLGLDVDPQALAIARETLADYGERVILRQVSYIDMTDAAREVGWEQVYAILLDLGISSLQINTPERGFAFMLDGPLDMRFDPGGSRPPASELVNTLDERELADLFYKLGEEPEGRRVARLIVNQRPFETTRQLAQVIENAIPQHKRGKIHPATRIFQALRIAVNDELATIERALPQAIDLLRPGGRLAVISFHSLEDRIVKQTFKEASTDCLCPSNFPVCVCGHRASMRMINRKPIVPTEAEMAQNPRSRSAKLRIAEKL